MPALVMGETKLSEAVTQSESIVLKMVHCFKASKSQTGDICWATLTFLLHVWIKEKYHETCDI